MEAAKVSIVGGVQDPGIYFASAQLRLVRRFCIYSCVQTFRPSTARLCVFSGSCFIMPQRSRAELFSIKDIWAWGSD